MARPSPYRDEAVRLYSEGLSGDSVAYVMKGKVSPKSVIRWAHAAGIARPKSLVALYPEIARLYASGMSTYRIQRRLHVSRPTIRKAVRLFGVSRTSKETWAMKDARRKAA